MLSKAPKGYKLYLQNTLKVVLILLTLMYIRKVQGNHIFSDINNNDNLDCFYIKENSEKS